jgi:hypothetical protein
VRIGFVQKKYFSGNWRISHIRRVRIIGSLCFYYVGLWENKIARENSK